VWHNEKEGEEGNGGNSSFGDWWATIKIKAAGKWKAVGPDSGCDYESGSHSDSATGSCLKV